MKLLIETAIIFFGTLLAAAFIALGEPGSLMPTFMFGEPAPASAVNVVATLPNATVPPAN